ncbi:DUF6048 family protein [Sunxiuqinia sp. sy24]|uniref:DUF6048 family protein n=1 Tax=Sunxiuqinia sp. sy24 TaxID=3461495 RepID=UPI0040466DB6
MKIFSFTFILCLLAITSLGQQPELKKKPKRTDKFIHMDGLRVGMDLSRPMQHLWNKGDRYGTELSFDMELIPNLYPVIETGWEKLKIDHDYLDYSSAGSYTRFGFDYNLLVAEHAKDMDIVYVGLRYGFSFANQQVKEYLITNYWGDVTGRMGKQNYTAQWAEFVLGIKGEVFRNLFMGWSIRGKLKMSQKDFEMPHVYFNPGYGPAEKEFNFDFSYSIYYNLPFNFRK